MCMCQHVTGKCNVNGTPGYSWNDGKIGVHTVVPPELLEGDVVVFDEPGRCFPGLDAHCHHYTLVARGPFYTVLCRNGSGTTRVEVSDYGKSLKPMMDAMDSTGRYLFMSMIYNVHLKSERSTRERTNSEWAAAFVSKRIRSRKKNGTRRVWIDPIVPTDPT